jgi:ADP-dependent NAD(P)H-hydrate dehydratase / NAD(P)H-hydrate epimerase
VEPRRLLTRAEARAIDADAQTRLGLPGDLLMENAGAHVARIAADYARGRGLTRALVLCGPGNNGGDGFVAARHLTGILRLDVFLLGDRDRVRGDAQQNLLRLERVGGVVRPFQSASTFAANLAASPRPLVIDALFGIGLDRPLDGAALAAVLAVNDARCDVVAVDIPSGLDTDSAADCGPAIRATLTVTFVASKVGFTQGAGPSTCGRVEVVEIGFPFDRAST